MKSLWINPLKLNQVLNGASDDRSPIGFAYDAHNTGYAIFVDTNQESGKATWSKRGQEVKFNLRKSYPRTKSQG